MEQKLAENIKYFRKLKNWTQQDLANQLQISRSVVAKWESGSSVPDVKTLVLLSGIFEVSVDHLIGNHISRSDLLKEFQKIYLSKQQQLDEETIEIVDFVVKNPQIKQSLLELKKLPIRKQKVVHRLLKTLIDEIKKT
ncbi:MAG: helix-turn-helix transcriptional regulator [Bacillaceae bacterium]|nr:helix-turn-helix transcriptional regulator [Bacillaceae bacterium]